MALLAPPAGIWLPGTAPHPGLEQEGCFPGCKTAAALQPAAQAVSGTAETDLSQHGAVSMRCGEVQPSEQNPSARQLGPSLSTRAGAAGVAQHSSQRAEHSASHTQSAALRGIGRQAGVQEAGSSRCSPLSASPRYSLLIIRGQRAALTAPREAPQRCWTSVTSSAQLHRSRHRPGCRGWADAEQLQRRRGQSRGQKQGCGAVGSRSWRKDSPRPAPGSLPRAAVGGGGVAPRPCLRQDPGRQQPPARGRHSPGSGASGSSRGEPPCFTRQPRAPRVPPR